MRIAIIGAGMGGLTAALALQRAGLEVAVYEQADKLVELGAGLTMPPNATRVCGYLGLLERLRDVGVEPTHSAVRHYQTGEQLVFRERGPMLEDKYGAPYLQIHRADLHNALVDDVTANDPNCLHLNHRFVSLEQDGGAVTIQFADGKSAEADVVIGADGVRSEVRGALFTQEAPRFTGHVAWRGLVSVDDLPEVVAPDSGISIGPERLITRYFVRRREIVNVVAFARMSGWEVESWSEHADMAELLGVFEGWNSEVRMLLEALPPEDCFKWALFVRDPLSNWTQGRVTLLGDAAHPMLPFLGMGAATAIEDGLVIARCFQHAGGDIDAALASYQAERLPRTNFIMEESTRRVAQLQGERPDTYTAGRERNEESLGLFEYDAATVPVLAAAG